MSKLIEVKDKNYIESDKDESFTESCELVVRTTEKDDNGQVVREPTYEYLAGYQIKGKDCIYLNSEKVYLPNLPTEHQDIAGAFEEVLEKLQDEEGGDWQPPEMPEPDPYEIYLLIEVVDISDKNMSKLEIRLSRTEDAVAGYGAMTIDWGDGTVDEWLEGTPIEGYPDYYRWGTLTHNYTAVGRYLLKISATEHSCFLQKITPTGNMPYSKVLCAKLGAEIVVNCSVNYYDTKAFQDQRRLQYIKMSGKGGLPQETMSECLSLKRIDIAIPPQEIYTNQFTNCVNLEKFDFNKVTQIPNNGLNNSGFKKIDMPNCLSIGDNAFYNCTKLSRIYAHKCTYIGNSAFANCYNLQEIVVAENCTFGTNCFADCYSLYPRPDGSVN